MRHPAKSLTLLAAILAVACLLAGCGSTASSVLGNLPSRPATNTGAGTTSAAPPPTSAAPPPTSAAPPPTVTVTATTSAPAASPTASPTPGTGSGTSLLWLWILLGAAVLAGLIFWISHSARRRSASAASWQSRLIDAYAKGSALHDAMSVAEGPGGLIAADAGARWADIQRRADDLAQTLYGLRESVQDPAEQARIADVLASLQAVRSAMDAERAPGGASPNQAEVVRSRLYAFELSLRALRGSGQEYT
ncbi:MAG TPA: hypothetical protein VIY52_18525 [Streptosporangiaceae bacterium]